MTDIYLEQKYINLLAPYLKQFKKRGDFLWNFKCPLCGDSHKDELKTRGYIFRRGQNTFFYCHNCFRKMRFTKFLEHISPSLYRDFLLDSFGDKKVEVPNAEDFVCEPVFADASVLDNYPTITTLPENHYVRTYVSGRMIPKEHWSSIYFAENFKELIDELIPDHGKKLYPEPRLVLPFYSKDKTLLGLQGRVFGDSKIRYMTIKVDENNPKVYGWDRVDTFRTIYVTEGPIDSLFLDNAVASMDADLTRVRPIIGLDCDYTFVYDNEPRNKQIVSNMRKAIDNGFRICVWPDHVEQKDVNEMVKAGVPPAVVRHIIDTNSVSGLTAKMRFQQWEKTK